MRLNFRKCAIVPLSQLTPQKIEIFRNFLAQHVPNWIQFRNDRYAEYLGIFLGPSAHSVQWTSIVSMFLDRVLMISSAKLAFSLAVKAYNILCITVFSYLLQFIPLPENHRYIENMPSANVFQFLLIC